MDEHATKHTAQKSSKSAGSKYEVIDYASFDDMGISDDILRGIYSYGFELPSAIQRKAIVPMIEGKELLAQAQSGTGKTGAFSIGTLQRVDPRIKKCQALLISPTRELAQQTHRVITNIGSNIEGLNIALCIGGTKISSDELRRAHILIGTPGRIIHILKERRTPYDLKVVVFDEADKLMEDLFEDQTKDIVRYTTKDTQICFFSATYSYDTIQNIKETILDENSVFIQVKKENLTLDGISQFYIEINSEDWKFDTLCDIYDRLLITQTIIFVNGKKRGEHLVQRLIEDNHSARLIHGDLSTEERCSIMTDFKSGAIRVLVSTDLLGRGIDVQQVSIVINYDIPNNKEQYIHRIGRSGRFGRKGVAINFLTKSEQDQRNMNDIIKYYNTVIEPMPMDISNLI